MVTCLKCGRESESGSFCAGCGEKLPPLPPPIPDEAWGPTSTDWSIRKRSLLHRARSRSLATVGPVGSFLLTFLLVGLPQCLNGQIGKGLVLFCVAVCAGIALFPFGLMALPIAAIDACCIASKLKRGKRVGEWEFF